MDPQLQQPARSAAPPRSLEPPSILVLTKDEEVNIVGCLNTLKFSDDIVLLDSHSTDRTVEIARQFPNVRVIQRPFDIEYKQRNFGLHDIQYKHPWVYVCDADERMTPELIQELTEKINNPAMSHVAYRLRYKNYFMGRWIKHASNYPVWIIRLMRPEKVTYEIRQTNIHPIVNGSIGELQHHFSHYSFNSGFKRWFQKHNFYSTREAIEGVKVKAEGGSPISSLFRNQDPIARRRTLKNFAYWLRGRAVWRFLDTYLLRGGWIDGSAGFHYSIMISMYEYWMEVKMRELEKRWTEKQDALVKELLAEPD